MPIPPPHAVSSPAFLAKRVERTRYFFLNLDPAPAEALAVAGGGCEHCLPEYFIRRRDFPFYSLEFVLQGRGVLEFGRRKVMLGPGAVFSYGPGLPHVIRTDADEPMVKYFVDFTGFEARALLEEFHLGPGRALQVALPQKVLDLYEALLQNGINDTAYSERLCAGLLRVLVLKMAESAQPTDRRHTRAFSTYLRSRQFLEERYLELQTLKDIAAGCRVDAAYLCRLFQRFDNLSPYQRLTRMKMSRAAQLLTSTHLLVKEVADQLGYEDPYHFSRVFKKVYGVAPEQFGRRPE